MILPSKFQLDERRAKSFNKGEDFINSLSSLESIGDKLGKYKAQKERSKAKSSLIEDILGQAEGGPEEQRQKYRDLANLVKLAPEGKEAEFYKSFTGEQADRELQEKQFQAKQQEAAVKAQQNPLAKETFKFNEPKLADINNQLQNQQLEETRLNRIEELSNSDKILNSKLATFLTKGGQLIGKASPWISPESQEFVKLITDMTSGIKDSYGARVTNFDLETYLKKLPSLLNSPEGKKRIVHDLKTINKINQLHNQGILDIVEMAGGSQNIALSDAESVFRKIYGPQMDQLKKDLVRGYQPPSKNEMANGTFKDLPQAQDYNGKIIYNDETGESLRSNGTEWVPVEQQGQQ